jgi:hypothetical protein
MRGPSLNRLYKVRGKVCFGTDEGKAVVRLPRVNAQGDDSPAGNETETVGRVCWACCRIWVRGGEDCCLWRWTHPRRCIGNGHDCGLIVAVILRSYLLDSDNKSVGEGSSSAHVKFWWL